MSLSVNDIQDTVRVRVVSRRRIARRVDEFVLTSSGGEALPPWTAGSHIDLHTPAGPVRQYSLLSAPDDTDKYRIAVERRLDSRGGSVSAHDDVEVGAEVTISMPRNHFALTRALGYVFVAGGIGITPVLALVDEAHRSGRPWRLVYVGRSRADMAFVEDVESRYPGQVTVHESGRSGRLDVGDVLAGLARGTAVYTCGPPSMLDAVARVCEPQPAVDSFAEKFTATSTESEANAEFELSLAFSGVTVTVPADRTILDVLDGRGVVAPSSCREGVCGTCETGVVSGEVDHRDSILSPEERSENESMMICVSRCTSGRLVLEL
ncbi:PDR/VanB family oxidoreductase [Gordonia terrae]|uniref:Oxidoreductase n=2 Tax=Gordonia terrae TaxID=2055 RepID=A0AAD0KCD9_9ACTN|nr:PDR/VanB family oxidoreductase [Gordonia terrae]VTR07880.1 oxidoreductase [Clostridioides difficile]ANY25035.1 ferredoxin [Gordonia terrae]AWO85783.1 oxidoreductase [Gordonia terrae]VTS61400.1 Phthalate dioxygenase reductase [Gordonia terrae]GAB42426.1 putative oxidoreductase [Gordonia terrae NBRC 100016]